MITTDAFCLAMDNMQTERVYTYLERTAMVEVCKAVKWDNVDGSPLMSQDVGLLYDFIREHPGSIVLWAMQNSHLYDDFMSDIIPGHDITGRLQSIVASHLRTWCEIVFADIRSEVARRSIHWMDMTDVGDVVFGAGSYDVISEDTLLSWFIDNPHDWTYDYDYGCRDIAKVMADLVRSFFTAVRDSHDGRLYEVVVNDALVEQLYLDLIDRFVDETSFQTLGLLVSCDDEIKSELSDYMASFHGVGEYDVERYCKWAFAGRMLDIFHEARERAGKGAEV